MKTFDDSALDKKIIKTLTEIGYKKPTPIQKTAIPKILEHSDIIASAATGTGKTAAFILPALDMLLNSPLEKKQSGPRILILVPTRELAIQVADAANKYSQQLPKVTTACIYGGVPYPLQRKILSRPYDILVATPGRLIDQMDNGRINLSHINMFVLDEADRMLDMGFIDPVKKIARRLPRRRQTLLFSATIDKKIQRISDSLQTNPYPIDIKTDEKDRPKIDQRLYYVDGWNHKMQLLDRLLDDEAIEQAIVFTSTKVQADDLAHELKDKGFRTEALHGDIRQRQRTKTIDRLRQGKTRFLVATDVAARGIDIPQLSHVFNVDLPYQEEDYVHRIGRTGRAGAEGIAVTFATYRENNRVSKIQKSFGSSLTTHTIEGLEPKAKGAVKTRPTRKNSRVRTESTDRRRPEKKSFSEKSKRGSFGRKDTKRSDGRESSQKDDRKSFKERSFGRKDTKRSDGRESSQKDDRKSFKERSFGRKDTKRSDGRESSQKDDRKSFKERSFGKKDTKLSEGRAPSENKPKRGFKQKSLRDSTPSKGRLMKGKKRTSTTSRKRVR